MRLRTPQPSPRDSRTPPRSRNRIRRSRHSRRQAGFVASPATSSSVGGRRARSRSYAAATARAFPFSAAACDASTSTTAIPAEAATCAMPAPIIPAPSTPRRSTGRFGTPGGAARELLRRPPVDEHRTHQVAGDGPGEQGPEVPGLDGQCPVEWQLRSFINAGQDREGRRIVVLGVPRRTRTTPVPKLLIACAASGPVRREDGEPLHIPWLPKAGMRQYPFACRLDEAPGGRQWSTSPSASASAALTCLPEQQHRERLLDADEAWQPLRSTARRQQAGGDLGQADDSLRTFDQHAVMAGKAQLVARAQCGAADCRDDLLEQVSSSRSVFAAPATIAAASRAPRPRS